MFTSVTLGSRSCSVLSWRASCACGRISAWLALPAVVGVWMVVKDWRDLVPSLRDTGAWRLGIHGRFAPLPALRYADGLPMLAGAVAFAIGIVNLAVTAPRWCDVSDRPD